MRKEQGNENQDERKSWLPGKAVSDLLMARLVRAGNRGVRETGNSNENQDECKSGS